jgi:CTP:phosphocholine cytidylyltransferase-like protein
MIRKGKTEIREEMMMIMVMIITTRRQPITKSLNKSVLQVFGNVFKYVTILSSCCL